MWPAGKTLTSIMLPGVGSVCVCVCVGGGGGGGHAPVLPALVQGQYVKPGSGKTPHIKI